LRTLARIRGEIEVAVDGDVTIAAVLNAVEAAYPTLLGTIRDQVTLERRPFIRFFACEQDYSLDPQSVKLPEAVTQGKEPLLVIAAIAGGA
jgi:hypothetical protein